jgi:hypothetical protein
MAAEICVGNSREDTILSVPHVDKVNISIPVKRVDYRI